MKNLKLIIITTIVGCAITLTSCKKEEMKPISTNTTEVTSPSTIMPQLRTRIVYDILKGRSQNGVCDGSSGICSWNLIGVEEVGWNISGQVQDGGRFGEFQGTTNTMQMELINPSMASPSPIIIHQNTFLPQEEILFHGFASGEIISGAYPVLYSPIYPNGYVEFNIIP